MERHVKNFASSSLWRRAAPGLLASYVLVTASGCGTLGQMGRTLAFWRSDDPATAKIHAETARPDEIADAMRATREKLALHPKEPYWSFRMGELYAAVDSTAQSYSYLQATRSSRRFH
jgi:hypothetical protein